MYFAGYQVPEHHFLLRRSVETYLFCHNWHSVSIPAYDGKLDNQTKEHVYINPAYLTTIVAGSAGSKEKISSGSAPKKDLAKYLEDYGSVQSL